MQRNEQAPEKRVTGDGSTLAVNSVFYTIQGEGPFAGCPAVFIRLAGCNLQCPMCDTEYSARGTYMVEQILNCVDGAWLNVGSGGAPLVVITGGEPFRQPIGRLAALLVRNGYRVQVETNGTLFQPAFPYPDKNISIVCSPKTGAVHRQLVPWISAWKYVATADSIDADGLPTHALEHPNGGGLYRPPEGNTAPVYLQPVDEQDEVANKRNMDAVVRSCMRHGYRLCLQLHKIIGLD